MAGIQFTISILDDEHGENQRGREEGVGWDIAAEAVSQDARRRAKQEHSDGEGHGEGAYGAFITGSAVEVVCPGCEGDIGNGYSHSKEGNGHEGEDGSTQRGQTAEDEGDEKHAVGVVIAQAAAYLIVDLTAENFSNADDHAQIGDQGGNHHAVVAAAGEQNRQMGKAGAARSSGQKGGKQQRGG